MDRSSSSPRSVIRAFGKGSMKRIFEKGSIDRIVWEWLVVYIRKGASVDPVDWLVGRDSMVRVVVCTSMI